MLCLQLVSAAPKWRKNQHVEVARSSTYLRGSAEDNQHHVTSAFAFQSDNLHVPKRSLSAKGKQVVSYI